MRISFVVMLLTMMGVGSVLLGAEPARPAQIASVRKCIEDLKSTDLVRRRQAALDLGKCGRAMPEEAVSALISVIDDKDLTLRSNAGTALATLGSVAWKAAYPIMKALKTDPIPSYATALGAISVEKNNSGEALLTCIKSPDPEMRRRAAEALGDLFEGAVKDREDFDSIPDDEAEDYGADVVRKKNVIAGLRSAESGDRDGIVRVAASYSIGRVYGDLDDAMGDFSKALMTGDEQTALYVIAICVKLGPAAESMTPALIRLLPHKNTRLGIASAEALAAIGPNARTALPSMKATLSSRGPALSAPVRAALTKAIQTIEKGPSYDVATLTNLIEQLDSDDADDRERAGLQISKIGPAAVKAVPALIRAAGRPGASGAIKALGAIGPPAGSAAAALARRVSGSDEDLSSEAIEALSKIGRLGMIQLINLLSDRGTKEHRRRDIIDTIGQRGALGAPATASLIRVLSDKDRSMRLASVKALGNIGLVLAHSRSDDATAKRIVSALEGVGARDRDAGVKSAASGAVDSIKRVLRSILKPGRGPRTLPR